MFCPMTPKCHDSETGRMCCSVACKQNIDISDAVTVSVTFLKSSKIIRQKLFLMCKPRDEACLGVLMAANSHADRV